METSIPEVERLQSMLDDLGVPRVFQGDPLSIAARCEFLRAAIGRLQTSVEEDRQDMVQFRALWNEEVQAHFKTEQVRQDLVRHFQQLRAQVENARALLASETAAPSFSQV